MNAKEFSEYLISKDACIDAVKWADGLTLPSAWELCPRGDWMLWLYTKLHPDDVKGRVLAAAHCANTVRHLLEDDRSKKAIDTAIAFGEGRSTIKELDTAAFAAFAASVASTAAYAAADAAKKYNRQQTADICRQYLKI